MHYVVNATRLLAEGVLTADQVEIIQKQSREAMVLLAVNTVLCSGILASALGFVFLLADALAVALTGGLFLALGAPILLRGAALYRMFGTAAGLIGAGMLVAGASVEMLTKLSLEQAGPLMAALGAVIALPGYLALRRGPRAAGFVAGSVFLMGVAMHLGGVVVAMQAFEVSGVSVALVMGYGAIVLALSGVAVDVRLVTALAIVPFAEMLNTSTAYMHAGYVFYSREPSLSILQMTALVVVAVFLARHLRERIGRHAGILAIMGFIVGNLCFLVASLWGDTIGESWWSAAYLAEHNNNYDRYFEERDLWRAAAFTLSAGFFSVVWALVLAAAAAWAAWRGQRGLFNAAMVFGALHGYTQAFESFGDQPLAYVIGGLAAVPLAWGLWRLNARFAA